ncbi:hypothetical protein CAter10_0813 [Collimonas arenae]|nr:hypothetical protein CAter10_0813 [Collimonas arenae]
MTTMGAFCRQMTLTGKGKIVSVKFRCGFVKFLFAKLMLNNT